jgi:hypothetical protein
MIKRSSSQRWRSRWAAQASSGHADPHATPTERHSPASAEAEVPLGAPQRITLGSSYSAEALGKLEAALNALAELPARSAVATSRSDRRGGLLYRLGRLC